MARKITGTRMSRTAARLYATLRRRETPRAKTLKGFRTRQTMSRTPNKPVTSLRRPSGPTLSYVSMARILPQMPPPRLRFLDDHTVTFRRDYHPASRLARFPRPKAQPQLSGHRSEEH